MCITGVDMALSKSAILFFRAWLSLAALLSFFNSSLIWFFIDSISIEGGLLLFGLLGLLDLLEFLIVSILLLTALWICLLISSASRNSFENLKFKLFSGLSNLYLSTKSKFSNLSILRINALSCLRYVNVPILMLITLNSLIFLFSILTSAIMASSRSSHWIGLFFLLFSDTKLHFFLWLKSVLSSSLFTKVKQVLFRLSKDDFKLLISSLRDGGIFVSNLWILNSKSSLSE